MKKNSGGMFMGEKFILNNGVEVIERNNKKCSIYVA